MIMFLQIGQRWRHVYDRFNSDRDKNDIHDFVVEITEITDIKVKCKILQIVTNDNSLHPFNVIGDEYYVVTIPRDTDYAEKIKGSNTWTYLRNQDRSII